MGTKLDIRERIAKHLLADGMDIIVDLETSQGSWLVDQRNGDRYLDCFSMFASMAVGYNHPDLLQLQSLLGRYSVQKPANSDAYSEPMAEFIDTFGKIAIPDYLPHAFFIEGGALAVENCLKAAFDWKVQKNFARGHKDVLGSQVIHFKQAFHGRSGYTLSLTNTADPRKTRHFPTFNWPRITNPKLAFPRTVENLRDTITTENIALDEIKKHLSTAKDDTTAIIIEPIQGEGGDNHFRDDFFLSLRQLCDENELLLIFDEVQTGIGLTGKFWAHEHFTAKPDLISFGKKTQVCGVLGGQRIDEIQDNVFTQSGRINSTFGGNLVDMIRCSAILKIIEKENLVDNACQRGNELLQGLEEICLEFPDTVSNPRGKGLMCAFDLLDGDSRNRFLSKMLQEKVLLVGCGVNSIRFRPHLNITKNEITELLFRLRNVLLNH